ncbi:MAG TPA: transporter substrate-binding domain-containing protein, partial [Vicinamibacterales bacterium]
MKHDRRFSRRFALAAAALFVATAGCSPVSSASAPASDAASTQPPFSGRATSKTPNDSESVRPDEPYQPPTDLTRLKWTGDLDGMIQRRLVRVLTISSKTTFFVDNGTPRGLVYEAFRQYEDDLNKRLGNKNVRVYVAVIPVANDELIPALLEGRGDIVAAEKLVTDWRRAQVDFANPTMTNVSAIVVGAPGVPPISTVGDLAGQEIYLHASDLSTDVVKQFNATLAADHKPPVRIRPAPEVLGEDDILEMVNAGLVKRTIALDFLAEFWKEVFPGIVLNSAAPLRTGGATAMMIRKNSPQLKDDLNAFLARYPKGSTERNVLFQKYLKSVKFARAATSAQDAERFRHVVNFIQKYSNQYQLDYLLMAAQAYQESGLDQGKRSPVGAIGVMQLMPETGKEMNVGDISIIDPNVHAGVKYIRFMMDKFYAHEAMNALNKVLFTFAAYNAGPGRINQMRRLAGERGLDANKWFNNVELVTSEKIGRETVQYVANIYKYYL